MRRIEDAENASSFLYHFFTADFAVSCIVINILVPASPADLFKILSFVPHFGGHNPGWYCDDRITGKHEKYREEFSQWGAGRNITVTNRRYGYHCPVNTLGNALESFAVTFYHKH